jgi:hypothetical protein
MHGRLTLGFTAPRRPRRLAVRGDHLVPRLDQSVEARHSELRRSHEDDAHGCSESWNVGSAQEPRFDALVPEAYRSLTSARYNKGGLGPPGGVMEYIIPFIVGWCGTGWPWRFHGPIGGGGTDPDNPWPDNCPMCGGILGGIAAIVLEIVLRQQLADVGFGGHLAIDFFAGSFAVSLVGGAMRLMGGNRTVVRG